MRGMAQEAGGFGQQEAARLTPYELVFATGDLETQLFGEIQEELGTAPGLAADPERFASLASVARALGRVLPEDLPAPALGRYTLLLFHAYHFWRFGRPLFLLEAALARELVALPPVGEWELTPPGPAGYLQLPRHLFWARVAANTAPEPVDGIFWVMLGETDPAEPPFHRLHALLALGLRPDRPGFSTIEVSAELAGTGHWADADARPDAADFGNVLPGGEIQGLYALLTEMEVLKLLSRCFWHIARHPQALAAPESATPAPAAPAASPHALPPSRLAFRRVRPVAQHG